MHFKRSVFDSFVDKDVAIIEQLRVFVSIVSTKKSGIAHELVLCSAYIVKVSPD